MVSSMKRFVVIFIILGDLMGCSNSYRWDSDEFAADYIDYQTYFITKWDNSFSIDEIDCIRGFSPILLSTHINKNGSTKYIVQCVLHGSSVSAP